MESPQKLWPECSVPGVLTAAIVGCLLAPLMSLASEIEVWQPLGGGPLPVEEQLTLFQLLQLEEGLDANAVRLRLIEEQSAGVVSVGDRYLRLAFCSVDLARIEPLVERVVAGLS